MSVDLSSLIDQHAQSRGGRAQTFTSQLCLYSFPEDSKEWEAVRDVEIEALLSSLRRACVAWADKARREQLKASL